MYTLISSLISYIYSSFFNFLLNIHAFYIMKTRKDDGFYKKSEMLFEDYDNKYLYLEEYYFVENGKEQKIVFISDKKKKIIEDVKNFKKNLENIFEKRNLIVYCGIKEKCKESGYIEDDITNDFRSFVYYFDKDDFTLNTFFSYLNINLDSEFVIYKNDNNFTEKNFIVKDILNKTFKELL